MAWLSGLGAKGSCMTDYDEHSTTGGGFAVTSAGRAGAFTPEQFGEEHLKYYQAAAEFSRNQVEPRAEDIDHKKPEVLRELMQQAADLGFFLVEVPEEYGGMALDKATSMLIAEALSPVGSFAVTYGAHTGIGTLPLVYYGTGEQRSRYLERLASGELMASYCLSEPSSGSDALAAKTTATLSADGKHYVLNGTKAWITNGGFADLYTVFAQLVDGDSLKFSAFLIERKTPGVSIGKEERKLGIRGSSTTLVILDNVKVPVENLLGEVGRGHKIAFNILNIGRWKLGIGSVGAAKYALGEGVRYAKERVQFKRPISEFGLIRQKIATSAQLIYAGESMAYRTAGLVDAATAKLDKSDPEYFKKAINIIEEYTIEASILKVFCSDALAFVVDEMLQVHGGNGYTEDYTVERLFRDARIMRIFEGTNEVNRLLIPATLLKRALQGRLPLLEFAEQTKKELSGPGRLPTRGTGPMADEARASELAKRAVVYCASYAATKYLDALKNKQRVLGELADAIAHLYGMDSVIARAERITQAHGEDDELTKVHCALASLYCFEARASIFQSLQRIAMMISEDDELDLLYERLGKLDQRYRVDVMGLQERVAEYILQNDGYKLSH